MLFYDVCCVNILFYAVCCAKNEYKQLFDI